MNTFLVKDSSAIVWLMQVLKTITIEINNTPVSLIVYPDLTLHIIQINNGGKFHTKYTKELYLV